MDAKYPLWEIPRTSNSSQALLTISASVYMEDKDFAFLIDPDNAETIREDLVVAINHYLVQGELKNLYFDQYLLQ